MGAKDPHVPSTFTAPLAPSSREIRSATVLSLLKSIYHALAAELLYNIDGDKVKR
jgi:hypothetical protein